MSETIDHTMWHPWAYPFSHRPNSVKLLGPKAPTRRRPKRVAKKIARRGGMLRTRGFIQSYYQAWPWLLGDLPAPLWQHLAADLAVVAIPYLITRVR